MPQRMSVSLFAACVGAACVSGALGSDVEKGVSPSALYLRAGTVNTAKAAGDIGTLIAGRPAGTRFVVQLDGPITPERRARMAAAGMRIGDYLPEYAYIVHFPEPDAKAARELEFVRWVAEYQNSWKLDPELLKRPYVTAERQALLAEGRYSVVVSLFSGFDPGTAEKGIWAIPGAVIRGSEVVMDHLELMVELPQAQVNALAGVAGVQYVEPTPEATARNSTTRWIIQSNQTNVTPVYSAGIHGEGQIVGVLDDGFDINHCSFRDATNNTPGPSHRKVVLRTGGTADHGTHTSGTAVGDNGLDNDTRGIAYAAKMAYSNWPSFTEAAMIGALTTHYNAGARVHTNSWGDDGTTSYNSLCRGIDSFQYSHEESQIMFAVTNLSSLKNPENAKNLVAVGASGDTPSQGSFCSGGTGLTSDQRRKPEIWAPGCNTNSANGGTACSTIAFTGTSMASPAVTGGAALVRQYYTDGFYPDGAADPSDAFTPSGALIKATMLNSGDDMSGGTGYPGNREGWGRLLLDRSLYFAGQARKLLVSDVRNAQGLSTNGVSESTFTVQGSAEQLRVTIVWTEPPAASGAAQAAVNNLDLEVVAPGGALYRGNVFSGGNSTTGGTADPRNNVEQVHLTNPAVGQWTLRVRGTNVAVGTQGFASVITGDVSGVTPPPVCYANCDGSTTEPVLNVADFTCFLQAFAAGESYANCDGSTAEPLLNVADFTCFLQSFAAGCP